MAYNGSGTFLINTAGQPVVSGTVISSTAFNALTADLATGLSTAITKDGQTTVAANLPMAGYKFTGLGTGSAATDSANLSQVQSTAVKLLASVSGADTITAVGSPTVAAYAAGQMFYFVAAGDNTGAVTLNIDSLGAKAVTRDGSTALAAGDIKSGEVCVVVYDGTRFQMINAANSFGDVTINGTLSVTGQTVLATSTGNVGIGTASPAYKLDVSGTGNFGGANPTLYIQPTTTTNNALLRCVNAGGTGYIGLDNSAAGLTANYALNIYHSGAYPINFSTNGTLRATIDSSGNLGLGTASPSGRLDVDGGSAANIFSVRGSAEAGSALLYTVNNNAPASQWYVAHSGIDVDTGNLRNGALKFVTNSTERARITAGGEFLFNTTTANTSVGTTALTVKHPSVAATYGVGPTSTFGNFYVVNTSGVGVYLTDGGTSWTGTSDERHKTALVNIENAAEKVSTLRAVTGRFNNDDESVSRAFLIAQDVEKVFPQAVDKSRDDCWGLSYTDTIPLLVAAIKELKAELDAAKVKIAALETK